MKTENNYGSLYRKFRPKNFSEILGQEHVVEALKRQVASGNLAHAYLFSGSRGTGKTSTALVFAKAINCLNPHEGEPCLSCENCLSNIDIIEMDAASHNSVDDIRELREFVKYAPARGRKKIYIVDEVHMLSGAAFNALLKTLEEPPEHVVFILATTELHVIPATVQSRCQRYDFKRVSKEGMRHKILDVSKGYGVQMEPPAVNLIIRMADGSMRDTLAMLEQCLSLGQSVLTEAAVAEFFGSARLRDIIDIVSFTLSKKPIELIELLSVLFESGVDVIELLSAIIEVLRDLMVSKIARNHLKNPSHEYNEKINQVASCVHYETINRLFDELTDISKFMRYSKNKESILEITLMKFAADVKENNFQAGLSTQESQMEEVLLPEKMQEAELPDVVREVQLPDAMPEVQLPDETNEKQEDSHNETKDVIPDLQQENHSPAENTGSEEHTTTKQYVPKRKIIADSGVSRSREELDRIWHDIMECIPDEKKQLLKNSQIGIFVGDEIVVNVKGLSKAREMLVEIKVKADVIHAAKQVTGIDCNVKFEGVEKDRETMEHDAKNVENYFKEKGIEIEIK